MKLSCTHVMLHANTRKRLCGFNPENRRCQRTAIWAQQRTVINGPGDPWEWTTQPSSTNTACFQLFLRFEQGNAGRRLSVADVFFFVLFCFCIHSIAQPWIFWCLYLWTVSYCVSNEWIFNCQFRFQYNYTHPECCLGDPD